VEELYSEEPRALGPGLGTTGNSREYPDLRAGPKWSTESQFGAGANAFAVHEDVDVLSDLALLIESAFHDTWVIFVEPLKHRVERRGRLALEAHLTLAT
jgi:hypothetical protein